jgi:hypothetical protein
MSQRLTAGKRSIERWSSAFRGQQAPRTREALQFVFVPISELDA